MASIALKRKRSDFTALQKREIVEYKVKNPKETYDSIARVFATKWGTSLDKSTVGDILKEKEKWMVVMEHDPNAKCLRSRPALYVNLEDCVFLWMSQVQSKGATISDDVLLEKAKEFGEKIAVSDDFKYSRGWFNRFTKRFGIKQKYIHGEAGAVTDNDVAEAQEEIKKKLEV